MKRLLASITVAILSMLFVFPTAYAEITRDDAHEAEKIVYNHIDDGWYVYGIDRSVNGIVLKITCDGIGKSVDFLYLGVAFPNFPYANWSRAKGNALTACEKVQAALAGKADNVIVLIIHDSYDSNILYMAHNGETIFDYVPYEVK